MSANSRATEQAQRPARGRQSAWIYFAVAVALLLAYLLTAAPGLTWANNGLDGGDFIAACATWGVPHPTGYPTYVLLGRLFLALPVGEPAFRFALFSAVAMALSGGAIALLSARAAHACGWKVLLTGALAGLMFGLAPLPWSQAVIAEVHALSALLVTSALTLVIMLEQGSRSQIWVAAGLGAQCGIGMGSHVTFGLMLPAIGFIVWRLGKTRGEKRLTLFFVAALLMTLVGVYAYLPLAARANPPVNWGDASTWDGFWWVVTGAPYRGLAFSLPLAEVPRRIAAWAGLLLQQFGVVGLVLGVGGVIFGRSRFRRIDHLSIWMMVVYSAFALGYDTPDSADYLIPAYIGFAWWIGLGLSVLMKAAGRYRREIPVALTSVLLLALGLRVPGIWTQVEARTDQRASAFVSRVVQEAPQDALVLTEGTRDTFGLWYARFAAGQRPDLHVIVVPLAQFDWYLRGLPETYPDLAFPPPDTTDTRTWAESLVAMNDLPVCRTQEFDEAGNLEVDFRCD